jgi:hypothetical protein
MDLQEDHLTAAFIKTTDECLDLTPHGTPVTGLIAIGSEPFDVGDSEQRGKAPGGLSTSH